MATVDKMKIGTETYNLAGGGASAIDDTVIAEDSTWSSSKINTQIGSKYGSSDSLTLEEINAGTSSAIANKIPNAQAVKDLSNNLVQNVYVGEDGKIHVVKAGADTVLNFSSDIKYSLTYALYVAYGTSTYYFVQNLNELYSATTSKTNQVLIDNDYLTLKSGATHTYTITTKKNGYFKDSSGITIINANISHTFSDLYMSGSWTYYFT